MERLTYMFDFERWYMSRDGHECDFLVLVLLPNGTVIEYPGSTPDDRVRVTSNHPEAVDLATLSEQHGRLEYGAVAEMLKYQHPTVFDDLNRWTPFKAPAHAS